MALNAAHEAFAGFAIDGKPKKIAQSANLWTVMRGSAAENEAPTVTLDFDFVWQVCGDACRRNPSLYFKKTYRFALMHLRGSQCHDAYMHICDYRADYRACFPAENVCAAGQLAATMGCSDNPIGLEGLYHQEGGTACA